MNGAFGVLGERARLDRRDRERLRRRGGSRARPRRPRRAARRRRRRRVGRCRRRSRGRARGACRRAARASPGTTALAARRTCLRGPSTIRCGTPCAARSRSTTSRVATLCTRPADVPRPDAAERDVRHLVADEPVEDAATFLRLDQLHVEVAPVLDGVGDRLVGDLVEHHALHRHLRLEHLEEVPRDRLALAVLVGREVELARVLERGLQLGDDVLLVVGHDVDGREVVVDVDAEPTDLGLGDALRCLLRALREVADVPDAGHHRVPIAPRKPAMVLAFAFGFDDHERFCHVMSYGSCSVVGAGAEPSSLVGEGGREAYRRRTVVPRARPLSTPGVPGSAGSGPSILRRRAPALDHSRAQPGSEGDPQRPEPVRRDRPDAHHLRRDRPARRLLPARRLAPLHRRDPRQPGQVEPGRRPARVLRRRRHRRPGRLHHRPEGGSARCSAARIRGFFKREYIDRTEDFFDRHGAKTIVLARFVPVVRTFAPVVAGIGKMSRRTFFSFNVIGAFIWVFGVTLAGLRARRRHRRLDRQVPLPAHRRRSSSSR